MLNCLLALALCMSILTETFIDRGRGQRRFKRYHRIHRPVCILLQRARLPEPTDTGPRSLTSILISRFLLELQEASQMVVGLDADDLWHSSRNPWESTPSFISSLGGFVNPELSVWSGDEDTVEEALSRPQVPEEKEGGDTRETTKSALSSSSTLEIEQHQASHACV